MPPMSGPAGSSAAGRAAEHVAAGLIYLALIFATLLYFPANKMESTNQLPEWLTRLPDMAG